MDQGWPAHQGWIPYQTGRLVCNRYNCSIGQPIYNGYNSPAGQLVYNEIIARQACQSIMAIIFNIRPASWSTMDLLMDWPVYLQWMQNDWPVGLRPVTGRTGWPM
jgi:hypothetical protein